MSSDPEIEFGATIRSFAEGVRVFDRFRLIRLLGQGGMGMVWLARDEKLELEVALKFLPQMVGTDEAAVADLARETRRARELAHPNIVRVYDFHQDATLAGISMEYVDGATLTGLRLARPRRVFEPEELRDWLGQLAAALDHAHGEKLVHRDLKPANLMVSSRGRLKVTDFGISASVSDSVTRVSKVASSSGSPPYMSPQQMFGEKASVSDDIYSLGATLYELLTGKPPFHSGNIVLQVQTRTPPSIAERRKELEVEVSNGGIPPAWEQTIAACLAKDPARRPASAAEVCRRIGASVDTEARTVVGRKSSASVEVDLQPKPATLALAVRGPSEYQLLVDDAPVPVPEGRASLPAGRALQLAVRATGFKEATRALTLRPNATETWNVTLEKLAGPETGEPWTVPELGLAMVWIKHGEFTMGSPSSEQDREADEGPQTRVRLSRGFWLGKYEVTQAEWQAVMGTAVREQARKTLTDDTLYGPQGNQKTIRDWLGVRRDVAPGSVVRGEGGAYPMHFVSWTESVDFCRKLTARERGAGRLSRDLEYTLPTEAQWEYACRAGTATPFAYGGRLDATMANFDGNYPYGGAAKGVYREATVAVGSFRPNPWDLHDMHGNVWEWCLDWYADSLPGGSVVDPAGPPSGSDRVNRGGSWFNFARSCRSASRYRFSPGDRYNFLGFRLALTPPLAQASYGGASSSVR